MPREDKGTPMGSYDSAPGQGEGTSSLTARRARLRGSLARATYPAGNYSGDAEPSTDPAANVSPPAASSSETAQYDAQPAAGSGTPATPQSAGSAAQNLPAVPPQAVEMLQGIDQALNACATNLAALQNLALEQTEVLKNLTVTLQNQTLFEIGLNLNSLTESLSAALEPMKAIGELVPAMDQLVSTLEGKEGEQTEKLSPDQLVTSLADQLSAGLIDPWTFKCAYMAVYPADHPADLLHRLVELLGTQRLSGDLFRAAYEAVQAAEPPARQTGTAGAPSGTLPETRQLDERITRQIEELNRANEELKKRQEERERELQRLLEEKENELKQALEALSNNSNITGDYASEREEEYRSLLESKDMELVEKESENNMLRAQIEELRTQTEGMIKDMQRQIADLKIAREEASKNPTVPPKPLSSFFDCAPSPARSLFDNTAQKPFAPSEPLPSPGEQAQPSGQQAQPHPQPAAAAPPHPPQPPQPAQPVLVPGPGPAPSPAGPPASMPVIPPAPPAPPQPAQPQAASRPQPATTPFSPGGGSYGIGVRAQVFEVIVRQALAGAPWREICAGPMQVNNISPEEVEAEVKRRQSLLTK